MSFRDRMKAKAAKAKKSSGIAPMKKIEVPVVIQGRGSLWATNKDGIPIEGKIEGYTGQLDPFVAMKDDPEEVYSYFLKIHRPGGDKEANIKKAREWGRERGRYV